MGKFGLAGERVGTKEIHQVCVMCCFSVRIFSFDIK